MFVGNIPYQSPNWHVGELNLIAERIEVSAS